mmetsp:Transcript_28830/g.45628  ORF Transcript_28830/g.45628 Transcript_28830/m.45628 type:complete len:294 (-) Transcript_28830:1315-2196(-)
MDGEGDSVCVGKEVEFDVQCGTILFAESAKEADTFHLIQLLFCLLDGNVCDSRLAFLLLFLLSKQIKDGGPQFERDAAIDSKLHLAQIGKDLRVFCEIGNIVVEHKQMAQCLIAKRVIFVFDMLDIHEIRIDFDARHCVAIALKQLLNVPMQLALLLLVLVFNQTHHNLNGLVINLVIAAQHIRSGADHVVEIVDGSHIFLEVERVCNLVNAANHERLVATNEQFLVFTDIVRHPATVEVAQILLIRLQRQNHATAALAQYRHIQRRRSQQWRVHASNRRREQRDAIEAKIVD